MKLYPNMKHKSTGTLASPSPSFSRRRSALAVHAGPRHITGSHRPYLSPPHRCGRELDFVHETSRTSWTAPVGPDLEAFEQEI